MKNLPDKIYLNFGECSKEEFDEADFHDFFSEEVTWSEDDVQGRNVEYVRKDAFIKKAVEYIKEHLFDYWSQSVTDESKFIYEFRKYMEE